MSIQSISLASYPWYPQNPQPFKIILIRSLNCQIKMLHPSDHCILIKCFYYFNWTKPFMQCFYLMKTHYDNQFHTLSLFFCHFSPFLKFFPTTLHHLSAFFSKSHNLWRLQHYLLLVLTYLTWVMVGNGDQCNSYLGLQHTAYWNLTFQVIIKFSLNTKIHLRCMSYHLW